MISLRKTLLIRTLALLTLVSVIATAASWLSVKLEVNGFLDNQMRDIALSAGQGALSEDALPQFDIEDEDQLSVQIWDEKGERIHRTGMPVDVPLAPQIGYSDVKVGDDHWRRYRAQDDRRTVQVSQRWSARDEVANKAAFGAAIPLLISLPFAWLLLGWSINQVLNGLVKLSADIASRDVNATDPIDLQQAPTELQPVLLAMNDLLDRQQKALDQQRRFVADAAHELRTPLAALQLQVDGMARHRLGPQVADIRLQLQGGARRASALVSQLLKLARAEAVATESPKAVDVPGLATSVMARFLPMAESRGIELFFEADGEAQLDIPAMDLDSILSNLIENAIRYSHDGGKVGVLLGTTFGHATIKVIDTGPGIPEAKLPFIYDRFFRAASQEIEGSGLGLSIVKALCDRNALQLSINNRSDGPGLIAIVGQLDQKEAAPQAMLREAV